jgi:hypothetical protein
LITPFQKRRGCLKPVEIAQVEAVIARLGSVTTPRSCQIDERTGAVSPILIVAGQLQRQLNDRVSFTVRSPEGSFAKQANAS